MAVAEGCPYKESCELFPLFTTEKLLGFWKAMYCFAGYERCARYKLSLEAKPMPLTLLPNGKHLPTPSGG